MTANTTTAITSACTCSVDGISGDADTRYKGYSFTGCGAHVEYKYSLSQGAGYERTWCYVTSPDDCPGEDPYIPEGFKDDNTLPEWKEAGAAWKECYDGYRCEAWWGSLDGQLQGDPVVLNAPLDWPDCCALCSNTDGDGVANASCAGWSFYPATGSCQLMSEISLGYNASSSWGVNGTIHGYPGYFEAPVTGCWTRSRYDLCDNMNLGLLIPGVILAFFGLLCVWLAGISTPPMIYDLRKLLRDGESRLQKASCVEVSAVKLRVPTGKGRHTHVDVYEGTFMTQDGALFVTSPAREHTQASQRLSINQKMLSVLYTKGLQPLGDHDFAARCQTPQGLRSAYSSLLRGTARHLGPPTTSATSRRVREDGPHRFDCLLLVGRSSNTRPRQPTRKVLLVGILGEDRLTSFDDETLGFDEVGTQVGFKTLAIATTLLIIFCINLLSSEAAQVMAAWTFDGTDSRTGAAIGLVLCVSIPFALLSCVVYRKAAAQRLIEECPPATDGSSQVPRARNPHRGQTRDIIQAQVWAPRLVGAR